MYDRSSKGVSGLESSRSGIQMAEGLGKERGPVVKGMMQEVVGAYAPLVCREWLSWGGELLFSELREEVEREDCELEEAKKREEEEESK
jgi:hypothetical protein